MPGDSPETVVNEGEAASTTASTETQAVVPPAESRPAQPEVKEEKFIPYPRFKEVNDRAKLFEEKASRADELERETAELRAQLAKQGDRPGNKERVDMSYAKRLSDKGVDPKAAEVFSEVMEDIARDKAAAHQEQLDKAAEAKRLSVEKELSNIATMKAEFKKSHEDYDEMEPLMRKEWEALDDGGKMAIVSSAKSYELLYSAAKGRKLDEAHAKGVDEGRTAAYEGKNLKAALSSVPGTTANPGKKFVPEDLAGMSKEFYLANLDKIKADLGV